MAWYDRLLEALWLTAAVAIPLAFSPLGFSAFELPKVALLRALVILMGLAALVRGVETWGLTPGPSRRRTPAGLLWPALFYGLALGLSAFLSVNPRVSFWGSYERQQGLLTLGAYLALFLLTSTGLRTRGQAERLWSAIVWGSLPIVVYGLVQAAGLDPLEWRTDAASPVLSTMGRSNFLGSYLVLVLPLTVGRILLAGRRWPYGLLLAGQLLVLALTAARGAWLGLAAAVLTGALAWRAATGQRRPAWIVLALAAVGVAFVMLLNLPQGPIAALAGMPGLDRLATLGQTNEGSTAARLTIWQATLSLLVARPWLGYGPETMRALFARVYPPQLVYYQGRNISVDRAHNLLLDTGMSTGILGIVALGALLLGFGRLAWRGLRTAVDRWERVLWAALAAAVVGHLAELQFGFDLTACATVFWLTLALGTSLGRGLERSVAARDKPMRLGALLPYSLPAAAALGLVAVLCLRPLLADTAYRESQDAGRPLAERQAAGQQAARLWPLEPEYRLGLAGILVQGADATATEAQLRAAERLSPNDPQIWASRGELNALWSAADPVRSDAAEAAYRRALELAPNVATYHAALGLLLVQRGRLQEAVVELERSVALDATDPSAFQALSELYLLQGREAEAASARREAVRWSRE